MSEPTLYQTLGVSPNAGPKEIQTAYKQAVRRINAPCDAANLTPEEGVRRQQIVTHCNEAQRLLLDEPSRTMYDIQLRGALGCSLEQPRLKPNTVDLSDMTSRIAEGTAIEQPSPEEPSHAVGLTSASDLMASMSPEEIAFSPLTHTFFAENPAAFREKMTPYYEKLAEIPGAPAMIGKAWLDVFANEEVLDPEPTSTWSLHRVSFSNETISWLSAG